MSTGEWYLEVESGRILVIEPTRNTMDCAFSSSTVDPVGMGVGNTPTEAALSFAASLRRAAQDIETRVANNGLKQELRR